MSEPWHWRQLWAAMWVLELNPGSLEEAVSALNRWAISPAPTKHTLIHQEINLLGFALDNVLVSPDVTLEKGWGEADRHFDPVLI